MTGAESVGKIAAEEFGHDGHPCHQLDATSSDLHDSTEEQQMHAVGFDQWLLATDQLATNGAVAAPGRDASDTVENLDKSDVSYQQRIQQVLAQLEAVEDKHHSRRQEELQQLKTGKHEVALVTEAVPNAAYVGFTANMRLPDDVKLPI